MPVLIDNLPSTLTLNTASIVVKRNGATHWHRLHQQQPPGTLVNVTLAQVAGSENTGTGDTIEIDYTATIKTTDPAGTSIPNTANLTYTSLPGPSGTTVTRPARAPRELPERPPASATARAASIPTSAIAHKPSRSTPAP